jgi:hypothetical protein
VGEFASGVKTLKRQHTELRVRPWGGTGLRNGKRGKIARVLDVPKLFGEHEEDVQSSQVRPSIAQVRRRNNTPAVLQVHDFWVLLYLGGGDFR